MTPEALLNSPMAANNTISNISSPAIPAEMPVTTPTPSTSEVFLSRFRDVWKQFESLNGEFGGDQEAYRTMQKAVETWVSGIVSNLPSNQNLNNLPPPTSPTY